MEKLYALIQKTPTPQKLAILGLVLALIVGGYYFLSYRGQAKKLVTLNNQWIELEKDREEKAQIANDINNFKAEVEKKKRLLEEKKKKLPENANMDQLLKTLNELSEKSEIKIMSFVPQAELAQAFYAEIPVRMELEGNYHEIATFFDKIAKEERIINISEIAMSNPEIRNGKVVLKATCLAKTFRGIPEQAAAVAQKAGAK
jgi:type IV pilus assembly protein PilO